jgi:hypothetical protein
MMEYEFDLVVTHAINVVGGSGDGIVRRSRRRAEPTLNRERQAPLPPRT